MREPRRFSRRDALGRLGAMALVGGVAGAESSARSPDTAALNTRKARRYSVVSPNRRLRVELEIPPVDAGAAPTWALSHRGSSLLLPGALGLRLANGNLLGAGAQLLGRRRSRVRDRWRPPYGMRSEHADRYDELTLELESKSGGISFAIIVRAYDEGVALRYAIRESSLESPVLIAGEDTHFGLPGAARVHASRDEGEYFVTDPVHVAPTPHPELTASCDSGPLADIPLTVQLPDGLTLVVTESDRRGYPRLMLRAGTDAPGGLVTHLMRFPGRATGYSGPGETVAEADFPVSLPFATPWRVVIVGERPADVIEHASLVQTLAQPSLLRDTAWLRPGRAFRSFRDNTTRAGLECVDFAVRRRLEYIEFDAHWYGDGTDPSDATSPVDGLDIRRVIEYARERNVGVILYVDRVPAMRQLDDILRTYSEWGVAGIKFGFIWEGRQSDVDWIFDLVRRCGERRLLVNLHDNLRPAGLDRTLPNYMTLEGVRGNEQFPAARHNVTLPFTRNVGGPMDYTICYANERNQTTNAHQLAMAVVYYSPLAFLYWYDAPAKYAQGDWAELAFLDTCPTTWDDTHALAGEIGEYVVVARRLGDFWFLGAMTNEMPREIEVPLTFLGEGTWRARIYADGDSAGAPYLTPVAITSTPVDARAPLRMALAPSGGQAIRFERLWKEDR